jgi:hypothetical protein
MNFNKMSAFYAFLPPFSFGSKRLQPNEALH